MNASLRLQTPGGSGQGKFPPALALSLVINVVLAGGAGWLLLRGAGPPAASATGAVAPIKPTASPSHAALVSAPAKPFSWSQLESQDFPVYISRLRGIGCPEPTIHDIIKGELDEIYSDKRQQLLAQRGQVVRRTLGSAVQRELEGLAAEEDRLLAQLLGLAPRGLAETSTGPDASAATRKPVNLLQRAIMAQPLVQPLVFQNVDLASLNLTPVQAQSIEGLRQTFSAQIGSSANPANPDYLRRWKQAQYEADNALQMQLGNDLYTQYLGAIIKQ